MYLFMIKFVDSNCVKYTNKVINYNTVLQDSIKSGEHLTAQNNKSNRNVTGFEKIIHIYNGTQKLKPTVLFIIVKLNCSHSNSIAIRRWQGLLLLMAFLPTLSTHDMPQPNLSGY